MIFKKFLVIGITILFFGISINPSGAIDNVKKSSISLSNSNTLYVGGTGPKNYTTIQGAIDDASDGDTVFVYDDSSPYEENIYVDKSINLVGENRNTTEIIYDWDNWEEYYVVNITADYVNIYGFTIISSREGYVNRRSGGILIGSCNTNISGNIITNENWCENDVAIELSDYSDNNIIFNNIIMRTVNGIYISKSNNNIIMDNYFSEHWFSISAYNSDNNNFKNNNFPNITHGIILFKNCNNNTITRNKLTNITCCTSIGIQDSSNNNTISNNTINSFGMGCIHIHKSRNNTFVGNRLIDGNRGILLSWGSSNNLILCNTFINCKEVGLSIFSNNNNFYHNNFINNKQNAYDEKNNTWDNGYPSGGNYWDDYTGYDYDGDGIGDNPYPIPGGNSSDRYPLMKLWEIIFPIANFTYSTNEYPVLFNGSSSYDPDGTIIHYNWDFGDSTTGHGEIVYHNYCEIGTYNVTLTVTDDEEWTDSISKSIEVTKANNPPLIEIIGPNSGRPGIEYEFDFLVTDPDDDEIYIWIDWGDGNSTGWLGPKNSGESIKLNHSWVEKGIYIIKSKVKDKCCESEWVEFEVEIPRTRAPTNNMCYHWFLERFPILERLLNLLI